MIEFYLVVYLEFNWMDGVTSDIQLEKVLSQKGWFNSTRGVCHLSCWQWKRWRHTILKGDMEGESRCGHSKKF